MKCAGSVISGKKVKGFSDYLNEELQGKCGAVSQESLSHHDVLLQCLRHRYWNF